MTTTKIPNSPELEQAISQRAKYIAASRVKETISDPLHPIKLVQKQAEIEAEEQLRDALWNLYAGHDLIAEGLYALLEQSKLGDKESLMTEFHSIRQRLEATEPASTKTPKEICALSEPAIQAMNQVAAWFYENKNYDASLKAYTFLTYLDPEQPAFWLGLAHSHYYARNFEAAITAYELCLQVDPEDLHCYLYIAHALQELGRNKEAASRLDSLLDLIKSDTKYQEIKESATTLRLNMKM